MVIFVDFYLFSEDIIVMERGDLHHVFSNKSIKLYSEKKDKTKSHKIIVNDNHESSSAYACAPAHNDDTS